MNNTYKKCINLSFLLSTTQLHLNILAINFAFNIAQEIMMITLKILNLDFMMNLKIYKNISKISFTMLSIYGVKKQLNGLKILQDNTQKQIKLIDLSIISFLAKEQNSIYIQIILLIQIQILWMLRMEFFNILRILIIH